MSKVQTPTSFYAQPNLRVLRHSKIPMMKNNWFKIFVWVFMLSACGGGQQTEKLNEEAVTKTVNDLFDAIKLESESRMALAYPDITELPSYYKSDKVIINKIEALKDKKAKVSVTNEFTTGLGKLVTRDIVLYLQPDSLDVDEYVVYDSEGLCGWDSRENNTYRYALKTGCINEREDVTDQQRALKMVDAQEMMLVDAFEMYLELMVDVTFKVIEYDKPYYSSYVSGEAKCINNSKYDIPKLKYTISYYNYQDELITDDEGYVTYDMLKAGRTRSFSFSTRCPESVWRISILPEFDVELIEKFIADKDYTGNEYAEYISRKAELDQKKDVESIVGVSEEYSKIDTLSY